MSLSDEQPPVFREPTFIAETKVQQDLIAALTAERDWLRGLVTYQAEALLAASSRRCN